MPFIKGGAYKINAKRQVLGNVESGTTISYQGIVAEEGVYELTLIYPAGENVTAFTPGYINNGTLYKATNLSTDNKPCNCIILETKTTGQDTRVQIYGICPTNLTLTANKTVFIRYGASPISVTPLLTGGVNEDCVQRLGRMITANILFVNIEQQAVLI